MMYEQLYRDVMRRTKRNLEIIEELHGRVLPAADGPYELTQLLNSFLGAVALPRERDLGPKLAKISIEQAEERWGLPRMVDNYPELPVHTHGRPKKPVNLDVLLQLMRNGLMHGNIEPMTGPTGEISRISIENRCSCNHCKGAPTWGTTLDVSELRRIFDTFVRVADHLYEVATMKQPDELPTHM